MVWSGLIWLVSFYWSGLVWSGLYGIFIGLVSIFHYFFFKLYIINHDVTYWCCLFFIQILMICINIFCIIFMI